MIVQSLIFLIVKMLMRIESLICCSFINAYLNFQFCLAFQPNFASAEAHFRECAQKARNA